MTRVKICGITNLEDALLSAKFGADALGFNFYERSPRYISPEKARGIVERLPVEVLKVGVFVNENLEKIVEIVEVARLDALQLHGEETPEFARKLKARTNLEIIKAFRVSPEFQPEDVLRYEVDAILLDAYNPREHGGTGETFDWEIAKKVREIFPKMYLAGGLSHENVRCAIYITKSFAVDTCSGIEEIKGKKDNVKLINFVAKVKNVTERPEKSLLSLLTSIHHSPQIYIGAKSLTLLHRYLVGFESALMLSNANFDTGNFFSNFGNFVSKKLNDWAGAFNWCSRILRKVDSNEEKAVDLFFALLEEFKLEKENIVVK